MDRTLARFAAALLLGTALTACSSLSLDTPAAKTDMHKAAAAKATTSPKSMAADLDVVGILVGRAREVADLQDGHLAQSRIEHALAPDEVRQRTEGAGVVRAVHQGSTRRTRRPVSWRGQYQQFAHCPRETS